MNWLAPKLHLRVAQKQILTPGLVQMVSVLALNRLELREMINQEMVENPVLEELSDDPVTSEDYSDEAFLKAETEKVPETEPANPFDEFDVASFFNQYLGSGGGNEDRGEREVVERPSFEQFLSSAQGLSDHLTWQLSVTVCNDVVREIADAIIGNLDENGYLSASLEEISQNGKYSMEDVEEALAVVQEFDPLGVASRNLRECLLTQLRTLDSQNTLAHQIVSECLPKRPLAASEAEEENPETPLARLLQANQLKEIARALNRPMELVKRAVDVIKKLDPRPGLRYNKTQPRLVEPDVYFRKVDDQWQVFMNDDDVPQLRLSPVYRRLMARDAADRRPQLCQGAIHRRAATDEEHRAEKAHDSSRLPNHHPAARRVPGPRRRPSQAHDDQGSGRRGRCAPFHGEPGGVEQICAHPPGSGRAAIFLFRVRQRAGRKQHVAADAEAPGQEDD